MALSDETKLRSSELFVRFERVSPRHRTLYSKSLKKTSGGCEARFCSF